MAHMSLASGTRLGPHEILAPLGAGGMGEVYLAVPTGGSDDLRSDGKWLAYTSDESGRLEVYVIPFDPHASPDNALATGRWQISTEGGTSPRWSRTGKELFFHNPPGTTLYVTSIKLEGGKIESSDVRKLFDLPLHPAWDFYDIGRDGSIYMSRYVGRQSSSLTMLLNWRPSAK